MTKEGVKLIEKKDPKSTISSFEIILEPNDEKDTIGFKRLVGDGFKDALPIHKLLYLLVNQAIRDRASDMYFENFEDEVKIRHIVDGIPYEMIPPPKQLYSHIAEALEIEFGILRRLKKEKRRLFWKQQKDEIVNLREFNDGDFLSATSTVHGKKINFNLTKITSKDGPQYHLKLFYPDLFSNLSDLAKDRDTHEKLNNMLKKEKGIILITGTPNSGRTTMLYHLLSYVNKPNKISVAVGRTYAPNGVHQFLIGPSNPDYIKTLKGIRKLNPGIVAFDDILDTETAKEAVHYANSGSLVFATVTASDAITGIEYLLSLGVDRNFLADSLQGIIGQRLMRRIDDKCKKSHESDIEIMEKAGLSGEKDLKLYHGEGCNSCNKTGYLGRFPIFQIITSEGDAMNSIKNKPKEGKQLESPVPSLYDIAKEKVIEGLTTLEELIRLG